ncbi:MAG TPA: tetratricopeptide repeat protein [Blastocatellia bacterium]|nr:tetratricopeptide repeat protein [Blastocatellia bacterium]
MNRYFWGLLLCCLLSLPAWAHGVTTEQIKRLTEQIKAAPDQADLYLRRGELHRQLSNAKAALEDFDTVQKLAPERIEIDVYRARLYLDAKMPEMAQFVLDRYLKLRPQHNEAILMRARANAQLGARTQAIQDYTTALSRLANPQPELFLTRAQLQIEARLDDAALRGLDEGIAKLGALVTLQLLAVEIEVKRQRWDAALARLETVAAQSPRKENWLVQRAEILLSAQRPAAAQEALSAAHQAIAALPDHLRRTQAIVMLEAKAAHLLKQTAATR